jgi:hypothetical protein
MGIGKLGKRLDKIARKAKRTLGRRGKEVAEAVLERAISILDSELKEADAAKGAAPGGQKTRGKEKTRGSAKPKETPRAPKAASASRRREKAVAPGRVAGRSQKARAGKTAVAGGASRPEPTSAG